MGGGNQTDEEPDGLGGGNQNAEDAPGPRYCAVGWYDSSKKEFWLFGGYGAAIKSSA